MWSCDLAMAQSCRGWPGVVAAAAFASADTKPAPEKPPRKAASAPSAAALSQALCKHRVSFQGAFVCK